MKRPSRILVPVDLSETSLEALEFSALLAQGLPAALIVVSVVKPGEEDTAQIACMAGSGRQQCLESLFDDRLGALISSALNDGLQSHGAPRKARRRNPARGPGRGRGPDRHGN